MAGNDNRASGTRAYGTMSVETVTLLAVMVPVDLLAIERSRVVARSRFDEIGVSRSNIRTKERNCTMLQWQVRWAQDGPGA